MIKSRISETWPDHQVNHTHLTYNTVGEHLYYVFQDEEIIDVFRFEPPNISPADIYLGNEVGVVLPIDVTLREEPSTIQVITATRPFGPVDTTRFPDVHKPVGSNSLRLRYAP